MVDVHGHPQQAGAAEDALDVPQDRRLGQLREGADPSLRNEAGLGAAEYFVRAGAAEDARWMQERADEYLAKYGTKANPVPAARR